MVAGMRWPCRVAIPLQGQAPAVLLHQVGGNPLAVVMDQGIGLPLRRHLHVRAFHNLQQPGKGGTDVGVPSMVSGEPGSISTPSEPLSKE